MKRGVQALKKTQQQSKELSMLHHLGYNKKLYNRRDEGAVCFSDRWQHQVPEGKVDRCQRT